MERPEATADDPLVSDALIDLRWHQRRQLRQVPDGVIVEIFRSGFMRPKEPKRPADRSDDRLIEWGLRLAAQRIESDGLAATLDRFADKVRQRELYGFLNANWQLSGVPGEEHPLRGVIDDAQTAFRDDVPVDDSDALLGYLFLVTWADWTPGDRRSRRAALQGELAAPVIPGLRVPPPA